MHWAAAVSHWWLCRNGWQQTLHDLGQFVAMKGSVAATPSAPHPHGSGTAGTVPSTGFGSPAAEYTGLCLFTGSSIPKKSCLDCSARERAGDAI